MRTLIVKSSRPRNPLVAAARLRRAGRHGPQPGAARQAGRRALKQELSRLDAPQAVRGKPPSV